jgi:ATP-dependent RNA helicase RhlE
MTRNDSILTNFHDFGLSEPITRALADEQYAVPTPIQIETIPVVLGRRDVVGVAQTGTGKTAAFALPLLQRLAAASRSAEPRACRVLVLSPTRELSAQIAESFRTYGRHLRIRVALAIGGVSIGPQARALAGGVDVLVATPGRLLDLAQTGAVRLDRAEVLVLDEADRMLDMGFIHDIRRIIARLPKPRQNLLFSATMPGQIAELAREILRDPVKISISPTAPAAERIAQRLVHLAGADKPAALAEILRAEPLERALVFTRTKHGADKVTRALVRSGFAAEAIHGNKSQNRRERVLAAFRGGRLRILVATDIAARGIDIDGISHVINYDLPNVPETYVHRIGRTARAGAAGAAISLCSVEERPHLRAIEKLIGRPISASHRGRGTVGTAKPFAKSGDHPRRDRAQKPARTRPRQSPASARHELATLPFLRATRGEQPSPSGRGPRLQGRRT